MPIDYKRDDNKEFVACNEKCSICLLTELPKVDVKRGNTVMSNCRQAQIEILKIAKIKAVKVK
jgi:hypothetical protein